jgi:uncharacterized protein YndB with AHSA1/START domain
MTMALPTPEQAETTRKFIKKAGGDATWDRLGEYLEKSVAGKDVFCINRTFDTSLETMCEMWTNPEHFAKWLAPTNMDMKILKGEIREGGEIFYAMTGNNLTLYGKVKYQEIKKPDRFVYAQQFADEKGNVARHFAAPTWPETMLTTVTLTAETPDRTRVTVTWEPIGNVTAEELETFLKARSGMTQGWTGSFDKLEDYLATRS